MVHGERVARAFEACNIDKHLLTTGYISFRCVARAIHYLNDADARTCSLKPARFVSFLQELSLADADYCSPHPIFGILYTKTALHLHTLPRVLLAFTSITITAIDAELILRFFDIQPVIPHRQQQRSTSSQLVALPPPPEVIVHFDAVAHARFNDNSRDEMVDMFIQLEKKYEESNKRAKTEATARTKFHTALVASREASTSSNILSDTEVGDTQLCTHLADTR
jgi:hypothetical protein